MKSPPTEGDIALVRLLNDDGRSVMMYRLNQQLDGRFFLATACTDMLHLVHGCHADDIPLITLAGGIIKLPINRISGTITNAELRNILRGGNPHGIHKADNQTAATKSRPDGDSSVSGATT